MRFNAANENDVKRSVERLKYLIRHKKRFDLIEKKPVRSIAQNNYLHLILAWYALEYGETLEYIKVEHFKKLVNKDIFEYEFINRRTGEVRIELRSSASLDSREMTLAIDRFRDHASKNAGIYLPEPHDMIFLQEIEDEINRNKNLLYL